MTEQYNGMNNYMRRPHRGFRWEDNINLDFEELVMTVWSGFIWLQTSISDGLL
jgi:hypothetical protein